MGKSKSKPKNKSDHSTPHLNLPERMTLPANIPQIPKTTKFAWLSPKTTTTPSIPLLETTSTPSIPLLETTSTSSTPLLETTTTPSIPLLETTSTHSNSGSNFSKFAEQAAQQQKQRMKVNILKRKTRREQERIKPLLVKYLQSYLNNPRYKIFPYVMGSVFGNLPDGYNSNMLYLCGYKSYNNNEMQCIEIPINIDALDYEDGIQEISYNVSPKLIIEVNKLKKNFNTTNKLDFPQPQAQGGKNNKKQQRKSRCSCASTKSHKHHRKSFTLKNVK
jgi:hypothetical protein